MSNPTVVLDSGVIDRATSNAEFRWVLRDLLEHGWEPVIPTVTLSEAITGRPQDASVNQLVNRIGTVDTDEATARRAGQLRFGVERSGSRRTPTGIDAIVAAHAADAQEAVVFTSDPSDLRRLVVDCPWVRVDKP
ncbi:MAG: PIN domain-containing protein [Acidimicrobiales bacterium]